MEGDEPQSKRLSAADGSDRRSGSRFSGSRVTVWNAAPNIPRVSTGSASSMTDAQEPQPCCVSRSYTVPQAAVSRAFQKLDAVHAPSAQGELRKAQVLDILARFDETFMTGRQPFQRQLIVDGLERSETDYTRVRWSDDALFKAFAVELNTQERIYCTVDVSDTSTLMSQIVSGLVVTMIVVSISLWMAGTMPEISEIRCPGCEPTPVAWMEAVDSTCVVFFTLEYILRLVTVVSVRLEMLSANFVIELLADPDPHAEPKRLARGASKFFRFVRSPSAIADLLTVAPYWMELAFQASDVEVSSGNMLWLRLFRILRMFRVFKLGRLLNCDLGRLTDVNNLLSNVLLLSLPAFLMTLTLVLGALVVFSGLMYTVERGSWYPVERMRELAQQPQVYVGPSDQGYFVRCGPDGQCMISPFSNMMAAAWWTLTTITTVGYGDVVPVTPVGKVIAFAAILYGTILLGLPIGIIGSQFSAEYTRLATATRRRKELWKQRATMAKRLMTTRELESRCASDFTDEGLASEEPSPICTSACNAAAPEELSPANLDATLPSAGVGHEESGKSRGKSVIPDISTSKTPSSEDIAKVSRFREGRSLSKFSRLSSKVDENEPNEQAQLSGLGRPSKSLSSVSWAVKKSKTMRWMRGRRVSEARHYQNVTERLVKHISKTAFEEQLLRARFQLEDALQTCGEALGLSPEQQQAWLEGLMKTSFMAGPMLDRLGVRILTVLAEAEEAKPAVATQALTIRLAWHDMCIACCSLVEAFANPTLDQDAPFAVLMDEDLGAGADESSEEGARAAADSSESANLALCVRCVRV